jgi:acetolactate synthase I/II/III large subunit
MHATHALADPPADTGPTPSPARSGAEIVCAALRAHGVHTIFGYAGGAILHFYDALHRTPGLRHVVVRHEQGAAHAAAGYARASGAAGV